MTTYTTRPTTLTDISGVGERKAKILRDAGFETVADIRDSDQMELSEIEGIGKALAARIMSQFMLDEVSTLTEDSDGGSMYEVEHEEEAYDVKTADFDTGVGERVHYPPAEDAGGMSDADAATYDTTTIDIDPEVAEATYKSILEEIEEHDQRAIEHGIILGVEQYKHAMAHVLSVDDRQNVEAALGVDVTVVPGPMIFVPKDNRRTLQEHIHDD